MMRPVYNVCLLLFFFTAACTEPQESADQSKTCTAANFCHVVAGQAECFTGYRWANDNGASGDYRCVPQECACSTSPDCDPGCSCDPDCAADAGADGSRADGGRSDGTGADQTRPDHRAPPDLGVRPDQNRADVDTSPCQGECTGLVYSACTCGADDPCGWANDNYCDLEPPDRSCAVFTPHFDDSADCSQDAGYADGFVGDALTDDATAADQGTDAGCVSETDLEMCARLGRECGRASGYDNCWDYRSIDDCGICHLPDTCGGGGENNICGCYAENDATFCQRLGKNCGSVEAQDNCGDLRSTDCGSCGGNETCGGAGEDNVCGCAPQSDAELCLASAKDCGTFYGRDNCDNWRTVESCGTCSGYNYCGGGGSNVCGGRREPSLPICTGDGLCWENPSPQGAGLRAACTDPSGQNWVAGDGGTVLNWNGTTWSGWALLTPHSLRGIWAASDTDVWAVGAHGVTLHYDGSVWTTHVAPVDETLHAVLGFASDNVWAVGAHGTVLHWQGSSWQAVPDLPDNELRGLGGTGPNDIWVVGYQVILHYDGQQWTWQTTDWSLMAVYASSASNAWAVGGNTLKRWNGNAWTNAYGARGNAIFGRSATDIWIVESVGSTYHFDGLEWSELAIKANRWGISLYGITGGAGELLAVGNYGIMARQVAEQWDVVNKGVQYLIPERIDTSQLVTSGTGEVFAGGFQYASGFSNPDHAVILRRSIDGSWSKPMISQGDDCTRRFGSNRQGEVWVPTCSNRRLFRWQQDSWVPSTMESSLYAVAPITANEAWGVRDDVTQHFQDGVWTVVPNPISSTSIDLYLVEAPAVSTVFAAGTQGTILLWDGQQWNTTVTNTEQNVADLSAPQSNFAVACGGFGVLAWSGGDWSADFLGESCSEVWARDANLIWAQTASGVKKYDGYGWTELAPGIKSAISIQDLHGDGDSVWILGGGGQVLSLIGN